jgi:outer membrane protein OmpA-like peptidoglycan-associated protein
MKLRYLFYIFLVPVLLFSNNELEIGREFGLFTSKNLSGYIKPLTTTISQSLSSGLFSVMNLNNGWSLGIDVTISGMYIPQSQFSYEAELPIKFGDTNMVLTALSKHGKILYNPSGTTLEPTIYGGKSTPVFAAPQNAFPPDSFYKSVAFAEGNNIYIMSGLPVIQLIAGLPTRTQIRFRFFTVPLLNSPLTYYTLSLNQNLDKVFKIFPKDSPYSAGINFTYHSISRNPGINLRGLAIGGIISTTAKSGFCFYSGLNYENLSGEIIAVRNTQGNTDIVNSPYEEVRRGAPLLISVTSFSNFRGLIGTQFKWKFIDLHIDASLISQPMITFGTTFWFFNSGENVKVFEPIEIPEQKEPLPKISYVYNLNDKVFASSKVSKQQVLIKSDFRILDKSGNDVRQIVIETFRSRQFRPFLPFIFYDENKSEIPGRYIQLKNEETKNYSLNEFKGLSSLETYYHVLNILGKRLADAPETKITLIGCNSNIGREKNNIQLSLQRAESVKKYLINIWKINPDRIKTIARNLPEKSSNSSENDGIEENRRVEIQADNFEITSPIIMEDTLRFIKPEGLLIKSDIYSLDTIKNWEFVINSQDQELIKFSGTGQPKDSIEIDFAKENLLKSKIGNEIFSYLKIENTQETGLSDLKKLPVQIITKDSSINVYNMILFDFNKSDLNDQNLKITNFINNDLNDNANVRIVGFTDRIGDDAYNKKLSEERAKSTANKLKIKNVEIIGIGEEQPLFENNTPEGRFYSRTVEVQIRKETVRGERDEK